MLAGENVTAAHKLEASVALQANSAICETINEPIRNDLQERSDYSNVQVVMRL